MGKIRNGRMEDFHMDFAPFTHFSPSKEDFFTVGRGIGAWFFHFPKIGKNSILARKWPPAREKAFVFGHAPKGENEWFSSSTIGRSVCYVKKKRLLTFDIWHLTFSFGRGFLLYYIYKVRVLSFIINIKWKIPPPDFTLFVKCQMSKVKRRIFTWYNARYESNYLLSFDIDLLKRSKKGIFLRTDSGLFGFLDESGNRGRIVNFS